MVRDMGCLLALQYVYPLHVSGSWPLTFLWCNLSGFMLWALFVIGEREGEAAESVGGVRGDESAFFFE